MRTVLTPPKGSPEALAWSRKLAEAREAKKQRRIAETAAILGPQATPEAITKHIKVARKAQKLANANAKEQRRQQKIVEENVMAAMAGASNTPPQAPTPVPAGQAPPAVATPPVPAERDELYNHPIFGSFAQPEGVVAVAIYRLPSDMPEHRGVSPGYLQSMSYEEFSEDTVRVNHGGGKFRAAAKDSLGRVVRTGDFTISGRAKTYTPSDDDSNSQTHSSRMGSAFRLEGGSGQPDDAPVWMRVYFQQQDERFRRLEALTEASLVKPVQSDEDKLDRWKKELEAKEDQEQKRHERRMAELKVQMEADAAKEASRIREAQSAAQAASQQQADLLKTIVQAQGATNTSLMNAVVNRPHDSGGGAEKFMAPMMEGMSAMMKTQSGIWAQLISVFRDSMGGEDNRTTGTRILDMIEKGVGGLWDKAGEQMIVYLLSQLGKPKEGAVPQAIPPGSQFQLPDGRTVPAPVCDQFVQRYRQLHGVNPSLEVCIAAFTHIMNNMAGQQGMQAGQQGMQAGQPQQQAPFAPQQQQQMAFAPVTQEQAEEFVRAAQQKAAEEATRAGKPPEEVAAAARAAVQQAISYIKSVIQQQQQQMQAMQAQQQQQMAQAQGMTGFPGMMPQGLTQAQAAALSSGQVPMPPQPAPSALPAPVALTPAPAAVEAARVEMGAAPPPQSPPPAQAAVAAAQAAGPPQPMVLDSKELQAITQIVTTPPQGVGTMLVQPGPIPPPGVGTMLVQAGPIPAPGSITIPWMHRNFLQAAVDSFQARQNPLQFLDLALKQGKLSPDAKLMIGRIYDDSEENEPLGKIVEKVIGLLGSRGVAIPLAELMALKQAPDGESWLETFFFACSCSTIEEAEKKLKEEG